LFFRKLLWFSSTPSYSTSYESLYVSSNSDCPSYGFAYIGSCYELPSNASQSIYSGFDCNYGYEKVGYGTSASCVAEVDHGYYIGSTLYCDYGYKKSYKTCIKEKDDYVPYTGYSSFLDDQYVEAEEDLYKGQEFKYYSFYDFDENEIIRKKIPSQCRVNGSSTASKPYFQDGDSCYFCSPGNITDQDGESCYAMTEVCVEMHGEGSVPISDGQCGCKSDYSLQDNTCVVNKAEVSNVVSREDLMKQVAELQKLLLSLKNR